MVRIIGLTRNRTTGSTNSNNGNSNNGNNNNGNNNNGNNNNGNNHGNNTLVSRRRLNESARTPQLLMERHPMYQYALKEYAQTVVYDEHDDGRGQLHESTSSHSDSSHSGNTQHTEDGLRQAFPAYETPPPVASAMAFPSTTATTTAPAALPPPPSSVGTTTGTTTRPLSVHSLNTLLSKASGGDADLPMGPKAPQPPPPAALTSMLRSYDTSTTVPADAASTASSLHNEPALSRVESGIGYIQPVQTHSSSSPSRMSSGSTAAPGSPHNRWYTVTYRSPFEEGFARNVVYEETYGDAYTGQPMKYVYPVGYQSMRPRSGPWRLSILICLCFTWLSVFVVGHCADMTDADLYRNEEIQDDSLMIEIRWCGSRPLYLMWVASMLITGLSAAYCGVIGYIKIRDFAVANARSQPVEYWTAAAGSSSMPGMGAQPSDYYVDLDALSKRNHPPLSPNWSGSESNAGAPSGANRSTIYQADGTPQFWGSQIFRPTQAAVAVTSR